MCGRDQAEHDKNLKTICKSFKKNTLTYNEDKCTFSTTKLKTPGFVIDNGEVSPNRELLKPLKELCHDGKYLKLVLAIIFAFCSVDPQILRYN